MKRYKLVNFLDNSSIQDRTYNTYKLLALFIISLIIIKLFLYFSPIKHLENNVSKIQVNNNEETAKEYNNLNFSQIKRIYSIIGYSNVDELVAIENNIEIKGKCNNLRALESIKDIDIIKDYSIENVIKENDYYNFKIRCKIG
ncbi:hypothetical protein [Clostridium sp. CCUG 7971]|uniref:hypothetical protein n=1 Tax=Clostridium sp. CCUG 7971 TaxID=2811414 RepID=UPI001ABA4E8A|nr:hypothetical protein [Clostridium sp. CCUG 7971]MBO3444687.1 hypothetical protein [Clostridium sp. CCUG 7971]